MKQFKSSMYLAMVLSVASVANAQDNDTIPGLIEQVKTDVGLLKNLKVSGYVQAQGQWLEKQDDKSFAVPSVSGGNFPAYTDTRFGVRRGRIKFAYNASPLSQAVIQIDGTEKGVALKDAYLRFTEPFAKTLSVTAGVFNRPFGYEIEYSSSSRETPERSRMIQTLFPQERDLGAMATLQAPKTSRFNFIKLDVAAIAGNGINPDIDKYVDFIGRVNLSKSFFEEKIKISGGCSYYWGGFANQTTSVLTTSTDDEGKKIISTDTKDENKYARALKELKGVDIQVSADMPWGMMTIRGEYIMGQQPSLSGNAYPTTLPTNDSYKTTLSGGTYTTKLEKAPYNTTIRTVNGYYVYFVQNILQSRHQLVFKYDVYDPNTKVSGSDIDGKTFTTADMMYSTIGVGYILKIDANTKLMIYGDMPKNESTKIAATKDAAGKVTDPGWESDRKDKVLTVRLQYKF